MTQRKFIIEKLSKKKWIKEELSKCSDNELEQMYFKNFKREADADFFLYSNKGKSRFEINRDRTIAENKRIEKIKNTKAKRILKERIEGEISEIKELLRRKGISVFTTDINVLRKIKMKYL